MLRRPALPVAFAIAALAVGVADAQNNASRSGQGKDDVTYKWVDEKGVTHYGDSVPEYSKSERAVLNRKAS